LLLYKTTFRARTVFRDISGSAAHLKLIPSFEKCVYTVYLKDQAPLLTKPLPYLKKIKG
jgi:hypothetical protein